MTLVEKQNYFAHKVASLIIEANNRHLLVTMGECWRSPDTCSLYEKEGKGISNSNHILRLAIDLNLFNEQLKLLTTFDEYLPMGAWWEAQGLPDLELCWGGRFHKPDIYHFSALHNGVR